IGAGTPTLDVREDFLNVVVAADGTVYSHGFDGTSMLPVAGGERVIPDELFIYRLDADTFEMGYYVDGVRNVIAERDVSNTAIGDAVGFYADIRSGGRRGALDDLMLFQPEGGPLTAGTLVIDGDLNLNLGSALEIDLFADGSADHIDVAGQLNAFGELRVAMHGSVAEAATYDILGFSSISGTFDDIVLPELDEGWEWDTSALLTDGLLALIAAVELAGDFNGSGSVEQGDLNLVLNNWGVDTGVSGVPQGWESGLPNGTVDQTELNAVLNNWGSATAPSFGGVLVPEPSLVFGAGAMACLVARRGRRA
ncbi:MAG: hypothetical protein AAF663_10465, partial [Planctomycetota bacterium]